MLDIFRNDAFSVIRLSTTLTKMDFVPGRVGQLVFGGAGRPSDVSTVTIEERSDSLTLVNTAPRGAPVAQQGSTKSTLRAVALPHIPLETTINADELIGLRRFGTEDQLAPASDLVNRRMGLMNSRFDLTLENLRMGAIRGNILDADGTLLVSLPTLFGVTQEAEVNFALTTPTTNVRGICQDLYRKAQRNAKMTLPNTWRLYAFCGDNFFDALQDHAKVANAFEKGVVNAERYLAGNYAFGVIEYGGIIWENYRGTDDGTTVSVGTDKAVIFPIGVPGLYEEHYGPANFIDQLNLPALPRYARIAIDSEMSQWIKIHMQMNPLPICTRPKLLMSARKA